MPGTALIDFDTKMVLAFEEAARVVSTEPLGVTRAGEMEQLVRRLLGRPPELRQIWNSSWETLETLDGQHCQDLGNRLMSLFESTSNILEVYLAESNQLAASGYPVPSATRLTPAIQEIERLRTALTNNWPWPDQPHPTVDAEMVRRSREQIARGEGQAIEDVIRELEGARHS
jgi:hypothetical protein